MEWRTCNITLVNTILIISESYVHFQCIVIFLVIHLAGLGEASKKNTLHIKSTYVNSNFQVLIVKLSYCLFLDVS